VPDASFVQDPDRPELVPKPAAGRIFTAAVRPARFADVHPTNRLRLDGIARYLQDLSADDTLDADLPRREGWVVRRTVVEVAQFPRYLERLTLSTWCSGIGSHYAERRAEILGDRGGRVEAASLWVSIDPETTRPRRVSEDFLACYGEAAGGRRITARLAHDNPPEDLDEVAWPLRATDFDMWQHVNNSVSWAILEEAVARYGVPLDAPVLAEVEHRGQIVPGASVRWGAREHDGGLDVWVQADGTTATTGRIRPLPPAAPAPAAPAPAAPTPDDR
jgi:acyl-ACP thioesterase